MKKSYLIHPLIVAALLSIVSCGGSGNNNSNGGDTGSNQSLNEQCNEQFLNLKDRLADCELVNSKPNPPCTNELELTQLTCEVDCIDFANCEDLIEYIDAAEGDDLSGNLYLECMTENQCYEE